MSGVSRTYYPVSPLPDTNARQAAMTLRPASTALLTIDSEDRYTDYIQARTSPSSPYNFSISKPESLMPGFMTRIGVSEIVFPWLVPNINEKTYTIGIAYSVGGGPLALGEIEINAGFQTPTEIAAQIQAVVRAENAGLAAFTCTYGTENIPTFVYATNNTTTIGFLPNEYNSAGYPYPSTTRQLFDLMGFSNTNATPAVSGFGRETLCQGIRYVDIVCNQLTNAQAQKDQTSQSISRDMLCRVYLGSPSTADSTIAVSDPLFCPPGCAPTVIYRNFTTPKQIQWIPNQNIPGFLQFQVYDDAGALLDESFIQPGNPSTQNNYGADWSMTMLVTEN